MIFFFTKVDLFIKDYEKELWKVEAMIEALERENSGALSNDTKYPNA